MCKEEDKFPETVKCPYCAEPIQPEAQKCKHCGEWLKSEGPGAWDQIKAVLFIVITVAIAIWGYIEGGWPWAVVGILIWFFCAGWWMIGGNIADMGEAAREKKEKEEKMKRILLCAVLLLTTIGCGIEIPKPERTDEEIAEIMAVRLVENATGDSYFALDLESVKTVEGPHEVAGLGEGESLFRVQGTIRRNRDNRRHTIRAFVVQEADVVEEAGRRWRAKLVHHGAGVDTPVGHLDQIFPR